MPNGRVVLSLAPAFERVGTADEYVPSEGPLAVLGVTLADSPEQWVERWVERFGDRTATLAVVTSGDAAAAERGRVTVRTVSSPSDLTGLGIHIGNFVAEHTDRDPHVVVLFDSLTVLLQYAPVNTVYRFLNVITTRLHAAGVTAVFHLDPATQDERTVASVNAVFDTVTEVRGDD